MAAGPARPEPVLRNGRGHNSESPAYRKNKNKQTNKKLDGNNSNNNNNNNVLAPFSDSVAAFLYTENKHYSRAFWAMWAIEMQKIKNSNY